MKQMKDEELLLQMKQLQEQIVPSETLIEKTKEKVYDEDRVYHHVFLWIAVPVVCIAVLAAVYYFAYARPTAQTLYTTVVEQEKYSKQKKSIENTLTEAEENEIYAAAGEQAELSEKEIQLLREKGKEHTDKKMSINRIGINRAKITVTTVTNCVYKDLSMVLYQDKTSYTFARTAKGWKLIEESIEEL